MRERSPVLPGVPVRRNCQRVVRCLTMTGQPENSRWAVAIEFDDPAEAETIPQSAGASIIAVYTQKGKPVHIISKVVMRMNAWMGYLTSP